jgi:hypothetical protein
MSGCYGPLPASLDGTAVRAPRRLAPVWINAS